MERSVGLMGNAETARYDLIASTGRVKRLRETIAGLRASNAGLADDGVKIRFEIATLRQENLELRAKVNELEAAKCQN